MTLTNMLVRNKSMGTEAVSGFIIRIEKGNCGLLSFEEPYVCKKINDLFSFINVY